MIQKVSIVIGLIVALLLAFWLFGIPLSYSEGDRSGVVYKLSRKGILIKTWEGELNLGVTGNDNGTASPGSIAMKIWEFSVADADLAQKVEEAARRGERVTLHYKQPYIMGAWYGKSEYRVTEVWGPGQ